MPYDIKTKDGIVLKDIPDDIKPDDPILKQKVQEARVQNKLPTIEVKPEQTYSKGVESARSAAGGLLLEYADELEAALRTGKISGPEYTQLRDELRAKQTQFAQENPKLALGTKIAGSLVMPGGVAVKGGKEGLTFLKNLGLGTTMGAVEGTGAATDNQDIFQKGIEGAAFGGGTTAGLNLIGRAIAPTLREGARELQQKGIRLTPGQAFGGTAETLEQSAESIPVIGNLVKGARRASMEDFNVAAMNDTLSSIGEKVTKGSTGRKALIETRDKVSSAYEELLPKLKLTQDSTLSNNLDSVVKKYSKGKLSQPQIEQLNEYISGLKGDIGNKVVQGEKVKLIHEDIKNLVESYRGAKGTEKLYGDALEDVQKAFKRSLEIQNPKYIKDLRNVDESYAKYIRVENAVTRASKQGSEPVFSPEQLAASIQSLEKTLRKGAIGRGTALMQDLSNKGIDVLGTRVPDSGTAGRLGTAALLTGGAAAVSPKLIPLGLLSGLYTDVGQKYIMPTLLSPRRPGVELIGRKTAQVSPYVGTGLMGYSNEEEQ